VSPAGHSLSSVTHPESEGDPAFPFCNNNKKWTVLKSELAAHQYYTICVLKIADYHKKLLEKISKYTPESQLPITKINVPNVLFSHMKEQNTEVHE
jgi:hypothetical protein